MKREALKKYGEDVFLYKTGRKSFVVKSILSPYLLSFDELRLAEAMFTIEMRRAKEKDNV